MNETEAKRITEILKQAKKKIYQCRPSTLDHYDGEVASYVRGYSNKMIFAISALHPLFEAVVHDMAIMQINFARFLCDIETSNDSYRQYFLQNLCFLQFRERIRTTPPHFFNVKLSYCDYSQTVTAQLHFILFKVTRSIATA